MPTTTADRWAGGLAETQAAQALVLSGIIGRLRAYPDDFAAFYLVTLVDPWTFHWGVVDAAYNAKLAYVVARACYAPVLVNALHGTTVVRSGDGPLETTASNLGGPLSGASLAVRLRDGADRAVRELTFPGLEVAGGVAVSRLADLDLAGSRPTSTPRAAAPRRGRFRDRPVPGALLPRRP